MSHRPDCICVTCTVLRDRVPRNAEPVYARGERMRLDGTIEPVQRGHEVEQAERLKFEEYWSRTYGGAPAFVGGARFSTNPNGEHCATAWAAWRARAIL